MPEEDELFESVGAAVDSWRLSEVAGRVFPDLERAYPRWRLARALQRDEAAFQEELGAAIRHRGDGPQYQRHRDAVEKLIQAGEPPWAARAEKLSAACREAFPAPGEAELLFAVVAQDDARAEEVLAALESDPAAAPALLQKLWDCVVAIRTIDAEK